MMIRKVGALALLLATATGLSACVVAPPPVVARGPGCVWVPPHYGAFGVFHPGHCR